MKEECVNIVHNRKMFQNIHKQRNQMLASVVLAFNASQRAFAPFVPILFPVCDEIEKKQWVHWAHGVQVC